MTVRRCRAALPVLVVTATLSLLSGCSGTHRCTPPGGGRCAGPEALPVSSTGQGHERHLTWGVAVSPDGRVLTAVVPCGGRLRATEGDRVLITWIAGAVGAGGMACARVPLAVHLSQPLGTRPLIDAVSGARLDPLRCPGSGQAVLLASCS